MIFVLVHSKFNTRIYSIFMKIIEVNDLTVFSKDGTTQVLRDVNFGINEKEFLGIVGPSGCGKSTLLRVFNRMNDLIEGVNITGQVLIEGNDILNHKADLIVLRKEVGMVFQRPNPFPLSIYDNITFGPRVHGTKNKKIGYPKIS